MRPFIFRDFFAYANKSRKITVRAEASPRIPFKPMLFHFFDNTYSLISLERTFVMAFRSSG